jgi:uncharacterized membrane protein YqjE
MESNKHHPPLEAALSIPELLQRLANETTLLVRQELRLAQAEIEQKIRRAGPSAGLLGAAALLVLGAFGTLTTTFIGALALAFPLWAAALIVTAVYGVVASIAAQRGLSALKHIGTPVPQKTIETLRDDAETIRAGVQRGR